MALISALLSAPASATPPDTAQGALDSIDARALDVITTAACGAESRYYDVRGQLLAGHFDAGGEGLLWILVGKMAWLNRTDLPDECVYTETLTKDPAWKPGPSDLLDYWDNLNRNLISTYALIPEGRCADAPQVVRISETQASLGSRVDRACMRRQINDSIKTMRKTGGAGTSDLPCNETDLAQLLASPLEDPFEHLGEWDTVVKELVRLLYMDRSAPRRTMVLESDTVSYMYDNLLSLRGRIGAADASVLSDCVNVQNEELGSPEETADRQSWLRRALDDLGDLLSWLKSMTFRVGALAISNTVGAVAAPFMLMFDEEGPIPPHMDIRVAETENHRLLIESSRYLTNLDLIERIKANDYGNHEVLEEQNEEVREWLQLRLHDIALHEFSEYNARPYTRYSLLAINNLYDFASAGPSAADDALQRASHIVLDLSQAKFAAGSNRGRRLAPFRRLASNDGAWVPLVPPEDWPAGKPYPNQPSNFNLYNWIGSADHERIRSIFFSGQMQLLPEQHMPWEALVGTGVVDTASGSYRPPLPVLDVAVRRPALSQYVQHAGREIYWQAPAFTVSAGGEPTGPTASTLGRSRPGDRGVAMPTTIIPSVSGTRMNEVFAFLGRGTQHERTANLCVHQGFACGVGPQFSFLFARCFREASASDDAVFRFYNSAKCDPAAAPELRFYLAARTQACNGSFCETGERWGVFDVIGAPNAQPSMDDPGFLAFIAARTSALNGIAPDASGVARYQAASGRTVRFSLAIDRPIVLGADGATVDYSSTRGLIEHRGNGIIRIKSPGLPNTVDIDLSAPLNPLRSEL